MNSPTESKRFPCLSCVITSNIRNISNIRCPPTNWTRRHKIKLLFSIVGGLVQTKLRNPKGRAWSSLAKVSTLIPPCPNALKGTLVSCSHCWNQDSDQNERKQIKMKQNHSNIQIIQHFPFHFVASLDPPISPVATHSQQQLALAACCL